MFIYIISLDIRLGLLVCLYTRLNLIGPGWWARTPIAFPVHVCIKNFYISVNWVIVHYFSKMEALLDIKMEATLEATKMEALFDGNGSS